MTDNNPIGTQSLVKPTMALAGFYTKAKRNKRIAIALILLGLSALTWIFVNYYTNRTEPLPKIETTSTSKVATVAPPTILFAIAGGPGELALNKPLDVALHPNGNIYATSGTAKYGVGRIEAFTPNGDFLFAFNNIEGGTLKAPVSIAIDSAGKIYVSDVRLKAIEMFSETGKYLGKVNPNGDKEYQWNPVGMAFDEEDNLYVTDTFSEHQVIVLDKTGKIKFKFGSTGSANKKGEFLGKFFFPNDIAIDSQNKNIYVADSNNRRVEVFSMAGKYQRVIETAGLPRGIVIDNRDRLYVVDALGHDVSIFKKTAPTEPTAMAVFGGQGIELGQLLYPNGVTAEKDGRRIFVADRENNRIDVFEWPASEQSVVTPVAKAVPLGGLLVPFGLALTWLFGRRRRYFADRGFMENITSHHHLADLKKKVGHVFVAAEVFEAFKNYREGDIVGGDVMSVIDPDEAAVKAAVMSHSLDPEVAVLFAGAQRGLVKPRILTEVDEAHLAALDKNIETMDHDLFTEYFGIGKKAAAAAKKK
jgi:DNA-binding beta-propeller fold protein YncE